MSRKNLEKIYSGRRESDNFKGGTRLIVPKRLGEKGRNLRWKHE
jgi:hypothetical protein